MHRAWLIGAGAAAGVAAWLYLGRDGEDPIDVVGDALVQLTTSDEDRLSRLEPSTQAAARQLIAQLAQQGIGVKVGQTLRTPAQERAAIDAGKSAVKTHSWHELGRALDLYPVDPATGSADMAGSNLELFRQMHDTAAAIGFRGIAFNADGSRHYITTSKGKVWDGGHLEWRDPYGSIAEAVTAEGAVYGIA